MHSVPQEGPQVAALRSTCLLCQGGAAQSSAVSPWCVRRQGLPACGLHCWHARLSRSHVWPPDTLVPLQDYAEVYPHLITATKVPKLVKIADLDWAAVDAVFCCLPHATTQEVLASVPSDLKIVDLSADFRLTNVDTYAEWCARAWWPLSRPARWRLRSVRPGSRAGLGWQAPLAA